MKKTIEINLSSIPLLLLLLLMSTGYSQIKTNQQILADLLVNPVLSNLDSLAQKPESIRIILKERNETSIWLAEKLREAVLDKNIVLSDSLTEPVKSQLTIVIDKVLIQIVYQPKKHNLFLKTSKYSREILAILLFYIKNNEEAILISKSKDMQYRDIIGRSDLEKIENPVYVFTNGTKMESKFIKCLVEPVFVTIATAGVVYLFYTLRSD